MWTWVLAVAGFGACTADPTLDVIVEHPAGVSVASTTVSVYQSDLVTCEQIEFGDLAGAQLQTAQVAEETLFKVAAPTGTLDGISRTAPKFVVARGYGSDGTLVAAGCVEKDEVVGQDSVTIKTEVAATASVSLVDPTGAADRYGLVVTTTDPSGHVIEGRPVSWRVYGPIGTVPASAMKPPIVVGDPTQATWQPALPTCTASGGTQAGVARVHPVPPDLIGGFAIQTRVAWAIAPAPLYTALNATVSSTVTVSPPSGVTKICAIGRTTASAALVCLTGGGAQTYTMTIVDGAASLTPGTAVALPDTIGVYPVPNGNTVDVYSLSSHGQATRVFGTSTPGTCAPAAACSSLVLDDLMVAPACGSSTAKLVVHNKSSPLVMLWMDLQGGAISAFPTMLNPAQNEVNASFNRAGCATEIDTLAGTSKIQSVIVLDVLRASNAPAATRAYVACDTGACTTRDLPVPGGGVGFSGGAQPYLIAPTLDATGIVLVSSVLAIVNGAEQLLELGREPSAGVPQRIGLGQFDGDGLLDKIWDVKSDRRAGSLLQISYARLVGTEPLSALSADLVTRELSVLDIVVGDLNGDGFDDIVITAQGGVTPMTVVAVVPTRVAAAINQIPMDQTCTP